MLESSHLDDSGISNQNFYNMLAESDYARLAPHLANESIRGRYAKEILQIMGKVSCAGDPPKVLDLGAGDGIATLPFLALGAYVVAVDISERQLNQLEQRCRTYSDRLEVRCADIMNVASRSGIYDVVVINSVLHHIPDYLALIDLVPGLLKDGGIFSRSRTRCGILR